MTRSASSTSPWKRRAKRAAGVVLVIAGVAFLFLPGPGTPLIVAGALLLGQECAWAEDLRARAAAAFGRLRRAS